MRRTRCRIGWQYLIPLVLLAAALPGCYELISWSANGRYIAFCEPDPGRLWLWDGRSERLQVVCDNDMVMCRFLPWGKEILYGVENNDVNLYTFRLDTGKHRKVVADLAPLTYDVSPNGQYLYYIVELEEDGGFQLRRRRLWHPSQDQELYTGPHAMTFPAVSADETRFLLSVESDDRHALCLLDVKEGAREAARLDTLAEDADRGFAWPTWVDEERIFYILAREGDEKVGTLCLHDMKEKATSALCEDVVTYLRPSLRPDRKRVAVTVADDFDVTETEATHIASVDLEDGKVTGLTPEGSNTSMGVFSPDGRRVAYFAGSDDGLAGLHVLDLETGEHKVIWQEEAEEEEGGPVRVAAESVRSLSGV